MDHKVVAFQSSKQTGTNDVRITFEDDSGQESRFILRQEMLVQLLADLHKQIELSPATPISLDRLRPGVTFQPESVATQRLPNGHLRLTLGVTLEGRFVTIPFELSPENLADIEKASRP